MYQIPTWRYWLVAVTLVIGLLLALPNVFGEDPAIQLARDDRAAIDEAGLARLRGILESKKVPPSSAYLEEGRVVLRFAHVDQQIEARDIIEAEAPGEYVVALTDVPRTPELLRRIGLNRWRWVWTCEAACTSCTRSTCRAPWTRPSSEWRRTSGHSCEMRAFRIPRWSRTEGRSK
jgi:hypothetical protein